MAALDLEKKWQVLSAGDGHIEPALQALDETLRQWFAELESLARHRLAMPPSQPAVSLTPTSPDGVQTLVERAPVKPEADQAPPVPIARPVNQLSPAPAPVVRQTDAAVADGSPGPEPEPNSASEDEALLASLDPETACAIKVKRRLGIKERSVRELLAELEAARAAKGQRPSPRRK